MGRWSFLQRGGAFFGVVAWPGVENGATSYNCPATVAPCQCHGCAAHRVRETVAAYRQALERLLAAGPTACSPDLFHTLVARDHTAEALSSGRGVGPSELSEVAALDTRFKGAMVSSDAATRRSTIASWRVTRPPHTSAWWWFLDERPAAAEARPHQAWTILTGAIIFIAICLVGDVWRRFFIIGPDSFGIMSALIQALIALGASGAMFSLGRRLVEWPPSTSRGRPVRQRVLNVGVPVGVLALIVSSYLLIPWLMRHYYNEAGSRLQNAGQLNGAMEQYQRAINLDPDFAQAHYNLGTTYDEVLDYDKAMSEYQLALLADRRFPHAYNNLARLYILRRNDHASALKLVGDALRLDSRDDAVRYALLKNRAWAYLGLKLTDLAEQDLREALQLRPEGAAAHCLLAQVFEARTETELALDAWQMCLRYEREEIVEANWLGTAQARLSERKPS